MAYPSNSDSVSGQQLRAFIERIERLHEERQAIGDDIKEIFAEARGNGFDTKAMRIVLQRRRTDTNERLEIEALVMLYEAALGAPVEPRAPAPARAREIIEEFPVSQTVHALAASEPTGDSPAAEDEAQPLVAGTAAEADVAGGDSESGGRANTGGENVTPPADTGEAASSLPEPTNVTPIRKDWKFNDKAHPECLDPGTCGGFSNMARCQRCKEAASSAQVA